MNTTDHLLSTYDHLFAMGYNVTFMMPKQTKRCAQVPIKIADILVAAPELSQSSLRGFVPSSRRHSPKKPDK